MVGPRVEMIEGQKVLVVERKPPLQPSLDRLLAAMSPTIRNDIRPAGARIECEAYNQHRWGLLAEGRHVGTDAELREISVRMCLDCGSVCVRDISWDRLPGLPRGATLLRKDTILGWYSGQRRNARTYSGMR